jgi:hypothetical protein
MVDALFAYSFALSVAGSNSGKSTAQSRKANSGLRIIGKLLFAR